MQRLFIFHGDNGIHRNVRGKRTNSPHLDRMSLTWSIWNNKNDQTTILLINKEPESPAEERSLERYLKKITSAGTSELIYTNNDSMKPHSDSLKGIVDTQYLPKWCL